MLLPEALPSALSAQVIAADVAPDTETLAAFLDVLLPADAQSPAASQLGVTGELLDIASQSGLYLKLIGLGTQWLNDTGRGPFHGLSEVDRNRIVAWMSMSDLNQIPGRFYFLLRYSAIELYFSHPESIAGLNLNPAPQPAGYPPPWG